MKIEIKDEIIAKVQELIDTYGIELSLKDFIEDILIREHEREL